MSDVGMIDQRACGRQVREMAPNRVNCMLDVT